MHRVSSYEGKKVPQCAWSNGLLLGQCICMYEIFPCSCYHIILASEQVLQSAGACLLIFFTEGWHVESSLQISVKAFLTNTWNILKGFIFVKSLYLRCFSLLSGHVISGQWSIGLAHFRDISLNFDHLQRVGAEYALPIYSLHQSSVFLVQQLIFR